MEQKKVRNQTAVNRARKSPLANPFAIVRQIRSHLRGAALLRYPDHQRSQRFCQDLPRFPGA